VRYLTQLRARDDFAPVRRRDQTSGFESAPERGGIDGVESLRRESRAEGLSLFAAGVRERNVDVAREAGPRLR
jgi:hypothetical protein